MSRAAWIGGVGPAGDPRCTVAHSLFEWLPITMVWVYDQVRFADGVKSIVMSDNILNLESFPWSPIYSPSGIWARRPQVLRTQALLSRYGLHTHPKAYERAIREHRPRVLHSHFGDRGWRDMPFCAHHKLRQVVTFYGYDVGLLLRGEAWRSRYRRLFDAADLFLCEGPHMAATLIECGCPEEKVRVQPLGVDPSSIEYQPRAIGEDGTMRILVASTFTEKKGIPYALQALALLVESGRAVRLTIIGDSQGGAEQEDQKRLILKLIEELRLHHDVDLLGFVSREELRRQAYLHDVFLAPSVTAASGDNEGGAPVTLVEMSATGMPIVSTRHCDIPFVVEEGRTGSLASERDPEGLACELAKLADDPALRAAMGEAGRRHVEARFDVRVLARRLEDHYRSVC
jgi:colanic acid/amylovoran biosynthesis glycosyltransferase